MCRAWNAVLDLSVGVFCRYCGWFDWRLYRHDDGNSPHADVRAGFNFAWIAFFNNKRGMALTAAIMFCVAAVMFTMYAELCIPEIILGFIGYVRIGKILNEENGGIQS